MDKCRGVLGFLFGHSYRPAVTKGYPSINIETANGSMNAIAELVDKTRPETFHGIYCKRCGKLINS